MPAISLDALKIDKERARCVAKWGSPVAAWSDAQLRGYVVGESLDLPACTLHVDNEITLIIDEDVWVKREQMKALIKLSFINGGAIYEFDHLSVETELDNDFYGNQQHAKGWVEFVYKLATPKT